MHQLILPGSDLYNELLARVDEERSSFGEISVDEILIAATSTINNPGFSSGYRTGLEDHQRYYFDILAGYARQQIAMGLERLLGQLLDHAGHQVRILDVHADRSMHLLLAHPEIEQIDELGREFHLQQEIRQALRL